MKIAFIIINVSMLAIIFFLLVKAYQLSKKRENLKPGDIVRFYLNESVESGRVDRIINEYWISIETIDGNVYTVSKKYVY